MLLIHQINGYKFLCPLKPLIFLLLVLPLIFLHKGYMRKILMMSLDQLQIRSLILLHFAHPCSCYISDALWSLWSFLLEISRGGRLRGTGVDRYYGMPNFCEVLKYYWLTRGHPNSQLLCFSTGIRELKLSGPLNKLACSHILPVSVWVVEWKLLIHAMIISISIWCCHNLQYNVVPNWEGN